ncbi:MAG: leishmanolysin-related zinc metalloendopeptidase [Pseudomonadota bacterium]
MLDDDDFDFETGPIGDTYTSGPEDGRGYNIDLTFVGGWSQDLKEAAAMAAETISDVIIGGLPDVTLGDGTRVDDLAITMTLDDIDGDFGTLAFAGPTSIRGLGELPATGIATFDTADATTLQDAGEFATVALHEMLHVLGFGTLWEIAGFDLLEDTADGPRFTGEAAIAAYEAAFPEIAAADPFSDLGVPVEDRFGTGSDRGHWDEAVFGDAELMTPALDFGGDNTLTDLTIASLADLGYVVDSDMLFV